jgi:hypothetical protein
VHELLDEQDRDTGAAHHFDLREDLIHDDGGEPERHLVGDQDARLDYEGASEPQHLLLTTREAAGELAAALTETREELDGALDRLAPRLAPSQLACRHAQVVDDREGGEDAATLGDVRQSGAPSPVRRPSADVVVTQPHGARGHRNEPGDRPAAGALPGAAHAWLVEHASSVVPAPRLALLQADFGFHNMLIDDGRVTALVDWEAATIGPPARELATAWNAIHVLMPWQHFVDAYVDAGGAPDDADAGAISYYRVLGALGAYMASRTGGHLFLTGAKRDLQTAHSSLDSRIRCERNLSRALHDAMDTA